MSSNISIYRLSIVFIISVIGSVASAEEPLPIDVINSGRNMIASGKASDAYQYLLQYERQYAGIPEYDYLLGVSAVDSGNANYAVLALQRSIAVNPKFAGAKIDLGRSYFLLQQYDDARTEFEGALTHDPPAQIKKVIYRYLELISKQTRKWGEFAMTFNMSGQVGNDSNANSATSSSEYIGRLNASSLEVPSIFYSGSVGGGLRYFASERWLLNSEAQYTQRKNLDAPFVDYNQIDAGLNAINISEVDYMKWDLTASRVSIGTSLVNYNMFGSFFARRKSYSNNSFNYLLRLGTIRYAGEDKSRDTYQAVMSGGYASDLTPIMALSTNTNFLVGRSHPVETTSPNGNFFTGMRVHSDYAIWAKFHVYAGAGLMGLVFDERFSDGIVFDKKRYDGKVDAVTGAMLTLWRGFIIQPQAVYTRNFSTVDLFSFNRLEYYVSSRMDF